MPNKELTQEEKQHIEALIRTTMHIIGLYEMELERLKNELKAHERFLRDYGQPVLIPADNNDPAIHPMLQEICDSCDRGEQANLKTLMGIKVIKSLNCAFVVN